MKKLTNRKKLKTMMMKMAKSKTVKRQRMMMMNPIPRPTKLDVIMKKGMKMKMTTNVMNMAILPLLQRLWSAICKNNQESEGINNPDISASGYKYILK